MRCQPHRRDGCRPPPQTRGPNDAGTHAPPLEPRPNRHVEAISDRRTKCPENRIPTRICAARARLAMYRHRGILCCEVRGGQNAFDRGLQRDHANARTLDGLQLSLREARRWLSLKRLDYEEGLPAYLAAEFIRDNWSDEEIEGLREPSLTYYRRVTGDRARQQWTLP